MLLSAPVDSPSQLEFKTMKINKQNLRFELCTSSGRNLGIPETCPTELNGNYTIVNLFLDHDGSGG